MKVLVNVMYLLSAVIFLAASGLKIARNFDFGSTLTVAFILAFLAASIENFYLKKELEKLQKH